MSTIVSQITGVTIVYSNVCSGADQRKNQSSASLADARRIHQSSSNSPQKEPVTRKKFPFDDVIMIYQQVVIIQYSLRDLTITKNKIVFYHQSYQHVDTWSNTWLINFLENFIAWLRVCKLILSE